MISNSLDNDAKTCPECHSTIPADAPGGICPGCVIGLGLSGISGGLDDPTMDMPKSSGPAAAFIAPSAADLDKLFEHLSIESLLGQGGMGAVYKAQQISLDRTVAVKILPPYAGSDPSFLERFQREARALARLTHPNIVMVFEFGQVSEMFYFVMEYVEGVNLREAILAGGLSTQESLRVIPQICEALQFAHDSGIVHRDIKPENILLDSKGRVKIADFGLAKLLERNAINFTLTSTNQVLGTVKYMAPEQIENPNMVDHRSDIYSLGVVFYELLTGELPLGRFDPPSAIVAANQPLDPVVMRTLEKQPLNRFQQASEVRTAVESIVIDDDTVPPQKPIREPRQENKSRNVKRLPAVNFQMTKVFAGFGKGKGLMRIDLDQEEIILDIEIKDFLGGLFRSEFKQVRIGFEHIIAFKDEFTWYSTANLEIQTDYFQEFATLPGAENGKVQLTFTSKDKKQASALCELVKDHLGLDERGSEPIEEEPVLEPLNVEELSHELDKPANGFFLAGCVDFIAAIFFFISALAIILGNQNDIEMAVGFALVACFSVCIGIFEIYMCYSAKSMQNYWVILIGCVASTLLWFHVGLLLMIPCAIYMLWQLSKEKFQRGFAQSESEQLDDPSQRSIVFADAQQQIELRKKLFWPTFWLGFAGLIAVVIASAAAISVLDSPGESRAEVRIAAFVFSISIIGLVNLIGALMLRFNPSIFWARAVVKFNKFPTNVLFPVAWWASRSIHRKINEDDFRNRSGNPYVQKDEGFTVA